MLRRRRGLLEPDKVGAGFLDASVFREVDPEVIEGFEVRRIEIHGALPKREGGRAVAAPHCRFGQAGVRAG